MKKQSFSLKPFCESGRGRIAIRGEISRRDGQISLTCTISGRLSDLVIPETTGSPERRDRLWKETCFEFFTSPKGAAHYWEFNLSPAGHWNVYRFESYRKGMQAEAAFKSQPFIVQRGTENLTVTVEISLDPLVSKDQALDVSVSAITQPTDETMNYWALTHLGHKPDFHIRNSFILQL